MAEDFRSRAPWSSQPSLKEMTLDVGVDFDRFIEGLKNNRSDMEMAGELGVSPKTITHLRSHFERYGIQSIEGQD